MKRIFIAFLAVAILSTLGAASYTAQQPIITIGFITYDYEATPWVPEKLVRVLELDMEILPPPEAFNQGTALPQPPRNEGKIVFDLKIADTAEAQVAAIDDFIAQGVAGILLVPVAETEQIRNAVVRANLFRIPVVVAQRPIPGLSGDRMAYIGLEPSAIGMGWSQGAAGNDGANPLLAGYGISPPKDFMIVASDLNDPRQDGLIRAMKIQAEQAITEIIIATVDDAFDLATAALKDAGDAEDTPPNYVVVADPVLAPEVARAAFELTEGTDRLIKVGSFGFPEGWKQLFDEKKLHMVVTQNQYDMFQRAALELKMFLVASDPLETKYVAAQVWANSNTNNYMNYPYDYGRTILFTFNRFWR